VSGLQAAATRWDGRRPPCPPPCAADLRRERERAGGGDGRRLRLHLAVGVLIPPEKETMGGLG
jgi:hypothetical protein